MTPQSSPQARVADWLLPIHRAVEASASASRALWASGPDYKISLGRTIAFYPLVGESSPGNLPVRWTTRSISIGDEALASSERAPSEAHGDWHFTLDHGAVQERYHVRRDGVEQTFLIHERPRGTGDLVIEGAIETDLLAANRSASHGPLEFRRASGEPLVSYGAAYALDAAGRTALVETSYADGAIRLHLCGEWIAEAAFPILVDPLLTRRTATTSGMVVDAVEAAHDDENGHFLVSATRLFAAGDYDLYSRVVTADASAVVAVLYNDVDANWSTQNPSAAYVGGANRWVLAFERLTPFPAAASIYAFVRDSGANPPAGVLRHLVRPAGTHQRYPSVGGVRGSGIETNALVAFQEDAGAAPANTDESRIRGALIDVPSATFGVTFALSIELAGQDSERPSVTRSIHSGLDAWLVAYQQYNNAVAGDDWDIVGRLVRTNGTLSNRETLAIGGSGHALWPKVDGREGRYLVAFGATANVQKSYGSKVSGIRVQRVNWNFWDPNPSFPSPRRTVRNAPLNIYDFGNPSSRPLAYNFNTRSHWGLGWIENDHTLRGARFGYDAGIVEDVLVYDMPLDLVSGVAVVYDRFAQSFPFVYGVQNQAGTNPVYKQDLAFQNAFQLNYGSSCSGTIRGLNLGATTNVPYAGSEFFALDLQNGATFAPTVLLLALGSANVPIGNSCTLLLDPASLFAVASGMSDALGNLQLPLPLVSHPFFAYDLYWQWLQLDPGTGGPVLSEGLRTLIL